MKKKLTIYETQNPDVVFQRKGYPPLDPAKQTATNIKGTAAKKNSKVRIQKKQILKIKMLFLKMMYLEMRNIKVTLKQVQNILMAKVLIYFAIKINLFIVLKKVSLKMDF